METREYNEIIAECRRFAKKEIQPLALDMDLVPAPETLETLWQKSHALDLPVLLVPERFGGIGYPELCAALVLDVLASECAGVASVFAHHFTASIAACITNNKKFLGYFTGEPSLPAAILFPDEMGESRLNLHQKSGGIVISGESGIAGNAKIADAFFGIIPNGAPEKDPVWVRVPKDLPGVERNDPLQLPGLKANCFAKVRFTDVFIEKDWIVEGLKVAGGLMDSVQNAYYGFIAAMAMGVSRKALETSFSYARQRYQYGKRIIYHQEIQRMLGAMQMKLGLGTAAYMNLFDSKKINFSYFPADARLVKAFCTDAAMEVVMDAIQIHGGYGYMHEYGLEKMMRDVKILQLLGGQNPSHQIRVVAEAL